MENKKNYFQNWIVPGLVMIVLIGLIIFEQSKERSLAGFIGEGYRQTSTSLTTTVGMNGQTPTAYASSTQVLAANDNRRFARCYNSSTNDKPLSFMLGSTATSSTLLSGLVVMPIPSTTSTPDRLEINEDNPFTGAVYAYAQATGTALCIEN